MRKNKVLALALCACMSVAAFTGCGGEKEDTSSKAQVEEDKDSDKAENLEDIEPIVENAASYLELASYDTVPLKTSEIEKNLQDTIDEQVEKQATYDKVKKGKVEDGDTVNLYYVGKVDGKAFENGSCTKKENPNGYNLTIGSGKFVDGFEEALVGKKIGGTYDIDVTFPESYPQNPDLAGKDTVFTVTVNYKNGKKHTPKFNDKFVKQYMSSSFKSVKDFKEQNRAAIVKNMAVSYVVDNTEIKEYPADYLAYTKKQLKTAVENYLIQYNGTMEDYLASMGKTEEEYDQMIEEQAKKDLDSQLTYSAIMQAENMEITDSEYQASLQQYYKQFNCEDESGLDDVFLQYYGTKAKNIIYSDILYDKISSLLVKNVKES